MKHGIFYGAPKLATRTSVHPIFRLRFSLNWCGQEEREVLTSIYGGDEQFTQTSDTIFTYRVINVAHNSCRTHIYEYAWVWLQVGEVGTPESFLVELTWGASYPDTLPIISLDGFYNNHLWGCLCSLARHVNFSLLVFHRNEPSKNSIIRILTKEVYRLVG